MLDKKSIDDVNKFLNTNEIKNNLIRISFYLFSYELLRNTVVDRIRDFYVTGFNGEADILSADYNIKVVNRKIEGKQSIFLSSLYWLEEREAITKEDIIS